MKDNFIYLIIQQEFASTAKIKELANNPYFEDSIAESFIQEVYKKTKIYIKQIRKLLKKNLKLSKKYITQYITPFLEFFI